MTRFITRFALLLAAAFFSGCVSPGEREAAAGRFIIAGKEVSVDVDVRTWLDSPGYDAHLERCFFRDAVLPTRPAKGCNTPRRFRERPAEGLSAATMERVADRGWTLTTLRERVDQFVIHYDVCGTSRRCFEVLQDIRGLSVHFLLDVDGTLYQTLDLAHRARHAGTSNTRSIGIEIAHFGAYPRGSKAIDEHWDVDGEGYRIVIPESFGPPPGGPFRPARSGLFAGTINGSTVVQPDFTEAQYRTLVQLTDALIEVFPGIRRRVPRLENGDVDPNVLSEDSLATFQGVLAHWHVTRRKLDPGPAFDWDRVVRDGPAN